MFLPNSYAFIPKLAVAEMESKYADGKIATFVSTEPLPYTPMDATPAAPTPAYNPIPTSNDKSRFPEKPTLEI